MKNLIRYSAAVFAAGIMMTSVAATDASDCGLRLSALFSDHAVLQRDKRIAVWGEGAKPFSRLDLKLGAVEAATAASADGTFLFRVPAQPAGGPYTLEVKNGNGAGVKCEDVYIGEVWLASGQSNMEYRMRQCEPGADPGEHPLIRQFTVKIEGANAPSHHVRGDWKVGTEANIADMSGVGYFFAQELQKKFPGVAVGVVLSALGGTSIVSWSSRASLLEDPLGAKLVEEYEADTADKVIWDTVPQPVADLGPEEKLSLGWASPDFDDSTWQTVTLPNWASDKQVFGRRFNGEVWFRKTVDIPVGWSGKDLLLGGGRCDKHDNIWLGGEKVGASGFGFDQHFCFVPRRYTVPGRIVKPGKTVIAIRVWSHLYGLGCHGPANELFLALKSNPAERIELAGTWRGAVGRDLGLVTAAGKALPGNTAAPYSLYDGAIAPLVPMTLRGILWYQGGSDIELRAHYARWQSMLIRDWRRAFGQGDLPFAVAYQAGFGKRTSFSLPDCARAELREAQYLGTVANRRTGLISTVDIGCTDDPHPKNKKEVGRRMCEWAMKTAYGATGDRESPAMESFAVEGKVIRVRFRNAGSGLKAMTGADGKIHCIIVAGADGKWHQGVGVTDGSELLISSDEVTAPRHARYAWTDYPDDAANLANCEGFPALPFRTDLP